MSHAFIKCFFWRHGADSKEGLKEGAFTTKISFDRQIHFRKQQNVNIPYVRGANSTIFMDKF